MKRCADYGVTLFTRLIPCLMILACAGMGDRKEAPPPAPLSEQVAAAYGIDRFEEVDEIRYTFNVQIGEKQISRGWRWMPKTERVVFMPQGDGGAFFAYGRQEAGPSAGEKLRDVDGRFINDQYWLLFPFHLVWDRQAEITEAGMQRLPIGTGAGRKLVVAYPAEGGYTPGDVYELYVGEGNRLTQWVYRKGGSETPTRTATWERHTAIGPLLLSLDHRGEGGFRVWFTDVAVRVNGSSDWIGAVK